MSSKRKIKNLKKRCPCGRRTQEGCAHPWHFNFTYGKKDDGTQALYRGCLNTSDYEEAKQRFAEKKAAIMNGTYVRRAPQPAAVIDTARPTFATVAAAYAADPEGLAKLSDASRRQHTYTVAFLDQVIVPPGMPFTAKPFADLIRADIKLAVRAKETPGEKPITANGRTWVRKTGGKVAANRLHDHLRSLWNWAIEEGYATASPFIRTRKGKNRLKHTEFSRDRRLREGEEAALLAHASPLLRDVIVAALETGMRKGEILSLTWKHVRFMQNDLYLPGRQTKARQDRRVPISPALREVLVRRQYGETQGPKPERFKFGADHFVFGDETGSRVLDIRTAWERAVLKAHDQTVERTGSRGLSAASRAAFAEIDLTFHDLRHEAGSRKLEAGWPLHAVSVFLGHADVTTTARYLNVREDYLQELTERMPLTLVKS